VTQEQGVFIVQDTFQGTLSELEYSLRAGLVSPSDIDLVALVREFLSFINKYVDDLPWATQALPQLAQVVELKVRLLLPKPPKVDEDQIHVAEEALEVILELESLEGAIDFLRSQRERRRLVLPARAKSPVYDRPKRPSYNSAVRLASLVSRFRVGSYFEVATERFSVADAIRQLIRWVSHKRKSTFWDLTEGRGWRVAGVLFAGLLELVKDRRILVHQAEAYGVIQLETNELERRDVA
jgi:segregation and condensation protein A